jgi:hypothetical protein
MNRSAADLSCITQGSGIELGALSDGFASRKSKPFRGHLPSTPWQVKHSDRTSLIDPAQALVLFVRFLASSYPGWYKRYRWYSKGNGACQGGTDSGTAWYRPHSGTTLYHLVPCSVTPRVVISPSGTTGTACTARARTALLWIEILWLCRAESLIAGQSSHGRFPDQPGRHYAGQLRRWLCPHGA